MQIEGQYGAIMFKISWQTSVKLIGSEAEAQRPELISSARGQDKTQYLFKISIGNLDVNLYSLER